MKRLLYLFLVSIAVTLSACNFAYGQFSRTNRIFRPCTGSTTPASVAISSVGAITLTPCSGQGITQTASGTMTFATSVLQIGNDADAQIRVDGENDQIVIGTPSSGGTAFQISSFVGGGGTFDFDDLSGNASIYAVDVLSWSYKRTSAATTGNQTINGPSGSVRFAAGTGTGGLTVTNSTVNTVSYVLATAQTNDATCSVKNAVPGVQSFVITMTANCTAETKVAFWVMN